MKRALLIASGTISGLGAVLAITPPQLSATSSGVATLPGGNPSTSAAPTQSTAPAATKTASAGKTATPKATKKATAAATPTQTTAPASADGSFTGDAVNVSYGIVQVKITVAGGKITDAQAVQAPSGRNQRWTDSALPELRRNTLAAQSNKINGASCCSYTSYGWYTSLTSALKKAGMI
jgi:uncharacterized protein with FMN-binding domain